MTKTYLFLFIIYTIFVERKSDPFVWETVNCARLNWRNGRIALKFFVDKSNCTAGEKIEKGARP